MLQDFLAITLIADHRLYASHLAFNPAQALDQLFFRIWRCNFHVTTFDETGARPVVDQPAQLKRPLDPQLLLDRLPLLEAPMEAKLETFLRVSSLWQLGHTGLWPDSDQRIIFSKVSPQLLH